MYVEQLYTGCLAEAAYYIESEGVAAVIDPLRETAPYEELAAKRGAKIKYVLETHFHADFVSGHIDLAAKTGAKLIFGPNAKPGYSSYIAEDGEELTLGKVVIKILHTPGHTMESTTYLLIDENGTNNAIFTGDTLFIGDVGRPDLAVKSDLSEKDLAGILYDSLHNKILTLSDDVIVYPGHGAGSQCGKNMSKETVSTIGQQRKMNYALQDMTKDQFVEIVTDGLAEPPAYFPENARINREGYVSIDDVIRKNLNPLSVEEFEDKVSQGALILDTRTPDEFEKGYVPGSLNIGLNGQYAPWVGALIPIDKKIVLVTAPGKEKEAVIRLARVGFENVYGYLENGMNAWDESNRKIECINSIEAKDLGALVDKGYQVLDVRRSTEVDAEHLDLALNVSLVDLEDRIDELSSFQSYIVHCAGGYRSMIASSILKAHGINNIVNVRGGFDAIKKLDGVNIVSGKCATQILNEKLEQLEIKQV